MKVSRGGRPGLSVSNSPCGPCGRKATAEEEEEEKKKEKKISRFSLGNSPASNPPGDHARLPESILISQLLIQRHGYFAENRKNGMVRRYDIVPLLDQDEEYSR